MEITFFGHSCFLMAIDSFKVLFDPFITPNELAKNIDISNIKPDFILLSHAHNDHIADVEAISKTCQPVIVSSFEVTSWFQAKGCQVHPMNHGGKWKFDFGTVKMVNAVHSSSFPDGSYGGNPAGFVVQTQKKTFYFAGDTALHQDMKQIAEDYKIDFAFLPIGDNFTMGIDDALKAARYVQTSKVIAMHYDTFPYIKINHTEVKQAAEKANIELQLLQIGQKINL
jgi:L-ascorbate metabolism protein UlaG (beta-lactamase superfamily)